MTRIALLSALALLSACAGAPTYGPASGSGPGYTDQVIETGRYRVTYRSRSVEDAENGALRRAAELTVQNGFDHFTVAARDIERRRTGGGASLGVGGSTGTFRSGVGVGVNVPLTGGREEVTVRMEILMGRGARPEGPNSYDAKSILGNLRGSINASVAGE